MKALLAYCLDLLKQEKKFIGIFLFYTLCITVLLYFVPLKDIILQVERLGPFAAAGFIAAYIVRGFIYFPTLYFLIASGILFSPGAGFGIYIASILCSAALSYGIGKYLHDSGRFPRFKQKIQDPKIKQKITDQGYKGVFFFHVTGISLDIPNYLSGFVGVPFRRFMLTVSAANLLTAGVYYAIFVL